MASPQLDRIIKSLQRGLLQSPSNLLDMRAALERMTASLPVPKDATITPVDVHGVPGEWTEVDGCNRQETLLFFHGGGYAMGSLSTNRLLTVQLARAANVRVLSLDYRLGPEATFPAALEDALSGYGYLLDQGLAPEQIALCGASAGGGLSAACLLALRDTGIPLPSSAVLLSPWLDLSLTRDSVTRLAKEDPLVQASLLRECAVAYLGSQDAKAPLASPLFGDLHDLPPLLLQVGSAEILLDDSTEFAAKAQHAGSEITLEVWDDMIHVWHGYAPVLPEACDAIEKIGAFLRQHLH